MKRVVPFQRDAGGGFNICHPRLCGEWILSQSYLFLKPRSEEKRLRCNLK